MQTRGRGKGFVSRIRSYFLHGSFSEIEQRAKLEDAKEELRNILKNECEIPEALRCGITLELPKAPVLTPCGHLFDEDEILKALKLSLERQKRYQQPMEPEQALFPKCPSCNQECHQRQLKTNQLVTDMIEKVVRPRYELMTKEIEAMTLENQSDVFTLLLEDFPVFLAEKAKQLEVALRDSRKENGADIFLIDLRTRLCLDMQSRENLKSWDKETSFYQLDKNFLLRILHKSTGEDFLIERYIVLMMQAARDFYPEKQDILTTFQKLQEEAKSAGSGASFWKKNKKRIAEEIYDGDLETLDLRPRFN